MLLIDMSDRAFGVLSSVFSAKYKEYSVLRYSKVMLFLFRSGRRRREQVEFEFSTWYQIQF